MLARLQDALDYTAKCIANFGEAYLPVFERLEAEVEVNRSKESALDRARRLAAKR